MEVSSRKHQRPALEPSTPLQIRLADQQEGLSLNSFGTTLEDCLSPKRTASFSAKNLLQLTSPKAPGSPQSLGGRRRSKAWHAQTVLVLVFIALLVYVFARPPRDDSEIANGARAFPTTYHRATDFRERQITAQSQLQTPRLDVIVAPLQKPQKAAEATSDSKLYDSRPVRVALEGTATGRAFLAEAVGRAFETALGSSAHNRETNVLTPEKVLRAFQVSGKQRRPSLSSSDAELRLPAEQLGASSGQRLTSRAADRAAKPTERALIELPAATQARTMAAAADTAAAPNTLQALHPPLNPPLLSQQRVASGDDPAAGSDGQTDDQQLAVASLPPSSSEGGAGSSRDHLADAEVLQELFRGGDHEEFVDFELETAAPGLQPDAFTLGTASAAALHGADLGSKSLLDVFLHGTEGEATEVHDSDEEPQTQQGAEETDPAAAPLGEEQKLQRARLRGGNAGGVEMPSFTRSEAADLEVMPEQRTEEERVLQPIQD